MKKATMANIITALVRVLTIGFGLIVVSGAAWADRDWHRGRGHPVEVGRVFDSRYHHDRYYLPQGQIVDVLPHVSLTVRFGGAPYYFHEGIWYRPSGAHFTVIAPPFGAIIPVLPPFYTTVWVRGVPYYYANDVYYQWQPQKHGYVVTRPPSEGDVSTQPAVATDRLFIYPKNGQSEQQQSTDRYECHSWAANETHYDPTQSSGGVGASESADKRAGYFRAMTACLEGRGYSVK